MKSESVTLTQVSKEVAESAALVGVPAMQSLADRSEYYIRTDGQPEWLVSRLTNTQSEQKSDHPKGRHCSPISADAVLVHTGKKYEAYTSNSIRAKMEPLLREYASRPTKRGALVDTLRRAMPDVVDTTIESTLSYFLHHTGVMKKADE